MTDFIKPGTKVHVEFDGVVEEPESYDALDPDRHTLSLYTKVSPYGFLKVRDKKRHLYHYVWIDAGSPLVTVTEPTDWEKYGRPQIGDIWEAEGKEYAALSAFRPDDGNVILHGVDNVIIYEVSEFKALNPRLVRRRGIMAELSCSGETT